MSYSVFLGMPLNRLCLNLMLKFTDPDARIKKLIELARNFRLKKSIFGSIVLLFLNPPAFALDCEKYFVVQEDAAAKARAISSDAVMRQLSVAKEVMHHLHRNIEKYYSNTGFSTPSALVSSLQNGDEITRNIWSRFKEDRTQFCMAVPERVREEIARYRAFKNGIETHQLYARNRYESLLSNLNDEEYKLIENGAKPKYGFLSSANAEDITPDHRLIASDSVLESYGGDLFVFRKKSLEGRTSFHLLDSYTSEASGSFRGPKVEEYFMPWERNEILAAVLSVNQHKIGGAIHLYPDERSLLEEEDFDNGKVVRKNSLPKDLKQFNIQARIFRSHYVELQFWGPLLLSDVESFYFTGLPPEGAFLSALQEFKIKIFDMRKCKNSKAQAELWWAP